MSAEGQFRKHRQVGVPFCQANSRTNCSKLCILLWRWQAGRLGCAEGDGNANLMVVTRNAAIAFDAALHTRVRWEIDSTLTLGQKRPCYYV